MERVTFPWITIGQGEIYCDCEIQLTASKNVVKETISLLEMKLFEIQSSPSLFSHRKLYVLIIL